MGYYRQIIHDWVLHRTASVEKASNAVRLTLLAHLKEHTEVSKKGKWEPDEDSPHNKCKRWAYYYALALELDWTMRRALLDEADGDGDAYDGYSAKVHAAVNAMWPGDDHALPLPIDHALPHAP